MNGQIKEITNLEDFKKVYKVFSGPPYNEKYTEEELEEIFREYQEKGYIYGAYNNEECVGMIALERGSMSYGIALRIGFKQIPNLFQGVERERVNGSIETMQNIFLEIDLNSLNRDALKQEIEKASYTRDKEREMD